MIGFFSEEEIVDTCVQCGLYKKCNSPKMNPTGKGKKGVLILAESPGTREDEEGIPLIGKAGQTLRRFLRKIDIDLDEDCVKFNAVNCHIEGKRDPKSKEIDACRHRVLDLIKQIKPKMILLLGGSAVESLIGYRWKKNLDGISKWRGWTIPDRDFNCWICPTFHPSFIDRQTSGPVAEIIFQQDLIRAFSVLDTPIPYSGKEEDKVEILTASEAVRYLRQISTRGGTTALDYETTGLKPHKKGHEIYTAAICENFNHAVSFLMNDEKVKQAMKYYLKNPKCKKIIANVPFEASWSKEILNTDIDGVLWDVLQSSHVLDNRPSITSVKFQAYVHLGIVDYASQIEWYLKADEKDGNAFNRIKSAPVQDILLYNGVDALVEYELYRVHRKLMEKIQ